MSSLRIIRVDHRSSGQEKEQVCRFWDSSYLAMTRSRLESPWDGERYCFAAMFDGERCVGTASCTVSARGQGILSQVYTDPEYRNRGICKATVNAAIYVFRDCGARAVYLAAWSDWIRNIYCNAGFVRVGMMGERHAFKLTLHDTGRDDVLFRSGQRTAFRPMGKGDQGDLTALFNAAHPVVVKHYDLGCFLGSHFEGEYYTLQNQTVTGIVAEEKKEKKGFRALVLDGEETILGFGTIIPSSRRHEGHAGTLDFLLHQSYWRKAGELLERLEENCELDHLSVFVEKGEQNKHDLLKRSGYVPLAELDRHLEIAGTFYDLVKYRKSIR